MTVQNEAAKATETQPGKLRHSLPSAQLPDLAAKEAHPALSRLGL